MINLLKIKYFGIIILSMCIFTNSYSSETNTSIIPYCKYNNLLNFETKSNPMFDTQYQKTEYLKLWDILDDALVMNNISKDKIIIVDDFISYCNTLCSCVNYQYIIRDLPKYCMNYYNAGQQILSKSYVNGLKSQYTLLNDINVNLEQLLNYYSNSMYSICISSINQIFNDIHDNSKNCIFNTISKYIKVMDENVNWLTEYVLPNLDIEEGKCNIKYVITRNFRNAVKYPMSELNKLKNNI